MAEIKMVLKVNERGDTSQISYVRNLVEDALPNSSINTKTTGQGSNIYDFLPTQYFGGRDMMNWGDDDVLVFNDSDYLSSNAQTTSKLVSDDKPDEFVWGIVPSSKEYSVILELGWSSGTYFGKVEIYGDSVANQFPTRAIIDGDTEHPIYSDDYRWSIDFTSINNPHTIEFTHWNRADYNACLSMIRIQPTEFELVNKEIKSMHTLSQSTDQPNGIYYGVIANTGSSDIIDIQGEIEDLVTDGILPPSNIRITIKANGNQVQSHIGTDSNYDKQSQTFSVQLSNILESWHYIQINAIPLQYTNVGTVISSSAYALLERLFNGIYITGGQTLESVCSETICDRVDNSEITVKEYLENINIAYPFLDSGSLLENVNKFCILAQLNLIQKDNGDIRFVDARPVTKSTEIIVIPSKMQFSNIDKDIIIKNKYDNVSIDTSNIAENIKYNTNVYSYSTSNISDYLTNTNNDFIERASIERELIDVNYAHSYVSQQSFYKNLVLKVPKVSNNGINRILQLLFGTDSNQETYQKWNILYDKYTGSATGKVAIDKDMIAITSDIQYNANIYEGLYSTKDIDLTTSYTVSNQGVVSTTATITEGNDIQDKSNLGTLDFNHGVIEYDTYYELYVTALVGKRTIHLGDVGRFVQGTTYADMTGTVEEWIPRQIEITLYGNNKEITVTGNIVNYNNGSSANNIKISTNELIQNGTIYKNTPISQVIANNILQDYDNGISTARITTSCRDMYDTDGILVKDWSKGEIVQVGDIVRIDKDNKGNSALKYKDGSPIVWKTTSRKFKYSGVSNNDLEVQEVKLV